jgi:hypothetical protein
MFTKSIQSIVLGSSMVLFASTGAQAIVGYSQGFETDNSGWNVFGGTNDATRVASGTNGITSKSGSFHAEAAGPNNAMTDDGSAATDWGGYSTTFGPGYVTSLDVYLKFGTTNDTRFDWDSALNSAAGTFMRDFVFNGGYYNDTDVTGSGDRFVFSASNNATRSGAFPKNPGRDPFAITAEGWYTFQHKFYDNGGVVACDLSILDSSTTTLHTWTLSNPADLTALAGGNRYGWLVFNEFNQIGIDNASVGAVPEPSTLGLVGVGVVGLLARRRRRSA